MRLRNIPRAEGTIQAHRAVIKRPEAQRGCWRQVFGNKHPIHIEIGMGKGRFIMEMAKRHPDINYIGIERYSSVLLRAIEKYDTEEYNELKNVRFVCMDARNVADVFAEDEVDRIYLNFSDPWPKARHAKRRLTSREFLARYEEVLKQDGTIEWILQNFTYDLHHHEEMNRDNVMTEYEEKFSAKGNPINKLIAVRQQKTGAVPPADEV